MRWARPAQAKIVFPLPRYSEMSPGKPFRAASVEQNERPIPEGRLLEGSQILSKDWIRSILHVCRCHLCLQKLSPWVRLTWSTGNLKSALFLGCILSNLYIWHNAPSRMSFTLAQSLLLLADSVDSAQKEIALWFKPSELTDYQQTMTSWVYESKLWDDSESGHSCSWCFITIVIAIVVNSSTTVAS